MHCDLYITCTPHSFPVPDLNNQVPALLLKVTDNGETDQKIIHHQQQDEDEEESAERRSWVFAKVHSLQYHPGMMMMHLG
jgi:hypothetical protein